MQWIDEKALEAWADRVNAREMLMVLTASLFRRNLASTVLQRSLQVGFFDFQ